jgi:hypothetical protein
MKAVIMFGRKIMIRESLEAQCVPLDLPSGAFLNRIINYSFTLNNKTLIIYKEKLASF